MTEEQRKSNKNQREKTIKFVNALKTPCVKCGETRKYVIDFHHIDPSLKDFEIQQGIRGRGRKAIENEVKKCVCLCKNCHTEFHYFYGIIPEYPVKALEEYLKGV